MTLFASPVGRQHITRVIWVVSKVYSLWDSIQQVIISKNILASAQNYCLNPGRISNWILWVSFNIEYEFMSNEHRLDILYLCWLLAHNTKILCIFLLGNLFSGKINTNIMQWIIWKPLTWFFTYARINQITNSAYFIEKPSILWYHVFFHMQSTHWIGQS